MTRRQRVLDAIDHKQTDFVPYQVDLTFAAADKLIEYTGNADFLSTFGNHISGTSYGGFTEVNPNYFQDYFGVVWNRTVDKDIGVVEEYLLPEPSMGSYKMPEIDEQALRRNCETCLSAAGDTAAIFFIGFSMFERAWTLRGMENLLTDMVTEPDFVHELLGAICEHNLKILDIVLEYPFDGQYFGDDWGQQSGLIMGPKMWREFIKPQVAKMYAKVKSKGRFIVQHSCGDINEILPDVIEIGLDVYQTFQPEIYDFKAVKKEYGKDLSFWGGISTQRDLPYVTPERVKEIVHDTINILGQNGGYIAGPTHAIPGDVPPANIIALIEALQNQA